MEEQNEILKQVFGESSDSDDEDQMSRKRMEIPCKWEQARKINGLWICQNFLSPEKQEWVLSAIQREEWFSEGSWNQAMRFGNLPYWAIELSQLIREAVVSFNEHLIDCITPMYRLGRDEGPLPMELLWREPLFDQLIANVYQPDEGICSHVDLMRFEDGIAILSLESDCIMHFSRVERESQVKEDKQILKIPHFLAPGSLVLMSGEARYVWKHEINRQPGFQIWNGNPIEQKRRTSVTLRKLCSS